jgi:hypothetical protein
MDAHLLPDAKGFASLAMYLTGDNEVLRQKIRDEVLATKNSHFNELGRMLADSRDKGIVAALGSPSSLRERLTKGPGDPLEIKVL